jgi:hypothetical protein
LLGTRGLHPEETPRPPVDDALFIFTETTE